MHSNILPLFNETHRTSIDSITPMDNSLTSLNWLPDFQIPDIAVDEKSPVRYPCPVTSKQGTSNSDTTSNESETEREEYFLPLSPIKRCMNQITEFERNPWKYENDPNKPPFSYTTIIYLAIRSCNKEKVMLGDIYQWIRDHFNYYRIAESTWQNSVRHNLSLNEFFRKIPRGEGDPGKGSFWQINPEYEHLLTNEYELQRLLEQHNHLRLPPQRSKAKGRKRNHGISNNNSNKKESRKRSKSVSTTSTADLCHLPGDLDWVSLLSSQKVGCVSCAGAHSCRPSFGSPVLGPPDLGHIGDPVICSPAVIPTTLSSRIPDTPPTMTVSHPNIILDEIMTSQESLAPLLPPWAESCPHSPSLSLEHPWAECKETFGTNHTKGTTVEMWSPETAWNISQSSYPSVNRKMPIAQLI